MPYFATKPPIESYITRFRTVKVKTEEDGVTFEDTLTPSTLEIRSTATYADKYQALQLRQHRQFNRQFREVDAPSDAVVTADAFVAEIGGEDDTSDDASASDTAPAGAPASPNIYADVEENGQAASILVSEYGVSEDDLKSEAGNITKKAIRAAAEAVGVAFPNL